MKALVLSGGGAKGGYQVGALQKWIAEDGEDYQILVGTSVGCINTIKLAHAKSAPATGPNPLVAEYQELRQWWEQLDNDQVYQKRWLWGAPALWNWSVFKTGPIRQLLRDKTDPERLRASGRRFKGVYVNWRTGEICTFDQNDENPAQKTYFSASYPVFFEPGRGPDNELYTDGGLRDIAPLGLAIGMGATEVDMIVCSDPDNVDEWDPAGEKTVNYALRTVDIMSTEILLGDTRVCQERNRTARAMALLKDNGVPIPDDLKDAEGLKVVDLRLLKPTGPMPDPFDFGPEATKRRFERGYKDACALG
jgi:NTE family protein